jgi:hypothetical protein
VRGERGESRQLSFEREVSRERVRQGKAFDRERQKHLKISDEPERVRVTICFHVVR